jgi:hypothetical protein
LFSRDVNTVSFPGITFRKVGMVVCLERRGITPYHNDVVNFQIPEDGTKSPAIAEYIVAIFVLEPSPE